MKPVTDETFEREVLDADQPVLVDFWAPWCTSCSRMLPTIDKIATDHQEWDVVSVNVADNAAIAGRFGVLTLPTLLVFRGGSPIARVTGAQSEQAILELMGYTAPTSDQPDDRTGLAEA